LVYGGSANFTEIARHQNTDVTLVVDSKAQADQGLTFFDSIKKHSRRVKSAKEMPKR
jgi:phosphatidylserine/phosphatidylglycerophosphate/cardiolipin synthase-like enzyme